MKPLSKLLEAAGRDRDFTVPKSDLVHAYEYAYQYFYEQYKVLGDELMDYKTFPEHSPGLLIKGAVLELALKNLDLQIATLRADEDSSRE